jgi:hypothetical protein
MKNILSLAVAVSITACAQLAHASDYGNCSNAVSEQSDQLITPLEQVTKVTPVTSKLTVLLVEGEDDIAKEGSVVPLDANYNPDLHKAVNVKAGQTWIGVVELKDTKKLWMRLWVDTLSGCISEDFGNRVFANRANAPVVFWDAIQTWEKDNPGHGLTYQETSAN